MGANIITKTDRQMEDRMIAVANDPMRSDTLQKARAFKRTWLELAEALLDHDEGFRLWRLRHIEMVERQIGDKPGTGGSTGVRYLQSTLGKRFFPELWEVRSQL